MCGVELFVKFLQVLEHYLHLGCGAYQISYSEMVSARSLSKATAWYCHDSCLIDHLHAVDEVRLFSLCKGAVDEFL